MLKIWVIKLSNIDGSSCPAHVQPFFHPRNLFCTQHFANNFLLLFLKRTFHVFRFTICCLVMKRGECREMQPEYAMNRKKTTILYNSDTVIMQKIFFGQRNFLHVIIAMLHYLCNKRYAFLGLGFITDFNIRSMGILNLHIENHCVPLWSLAFMKI